MEQGAFYGVREALEKMSPKADLAVVSSANAQAVEEEWSKYELKPYCKALLSQEAGNKAECIQKLSALGYPPEQILMVGDAMGDYLSLIHI